VVTDTTDDSRKGYGFSENLGCRGEISLADSVAHRANVHMHRARGTTPGSTLLNAAIFEFPKFRLIHGHLVSDGMISIIKGFGENPSSQNEFSPKIIATVGAYLDA
jgi:hypothetical protein